MCFLVVVFSMRKDVFDVIVAFQRRSTKLDGETARYVERLIKYGKRNGV